MFLCMPLMDSCFSDGWKQAVIVLIADRGNSLMNDIYFPMQ